MRPFGFVLKTLHGNRHLGCVHHALTLSHPPKPKGGPACGCSKGFQLLCTRSQNRIKNVCRHPPKTLF